MGILVKRYDEQLMATVWEAEEVAKIIAPDMCRDAKKNFERSAYERKLEEFRKHSVKVRLERLKALNSRSFYLPVGFYEKFTEFFK